MLSVKMGLFHLLTNMQITPSPKSDHPLALDPRVLTLQPKDGVYVKFNALEEGIHTAVTRELVQYPPLDNFDLHVIKELRECKSYKETCSMTRSKERL